MYLNWHDRAGEEPIILTARLFSSFSRNWPLFTYQSNKFFHTNAKYMYSSLSSSLIFETLILQCTVAFLTNTVSTF